MKKIPITIVALMMLFGLTSCSEAESKKTEDSKEQEPWSMCLKKDINLNPNDDTDD